MEAASVGKDVGKVGDRQKGRAQSNNIINCSFVALDIIEATEKAKKLDKYVGANVYFKEAVADNVIKIVKESL